MKNFRINDALEKIIQLLEVTQIRLIEFTRSSINKILSILDQISSRIIRKRKRYYVIGYVLVLFFFSIIYTLNAEDFYSSTISKEDVFWETSEKLSVSLKEDVHKQLLKQNNNENKIRNRIGHLGCTEDLLFA